MALHHLRTRDSMTPPSTNGYGDPYNTPPYLITPIQDQQSGAGQAYSFVIPEGCFVDAEDDPISYSATLVSGEALPAWLSFTAGAFSGTPASGDAAVLEIRVRADDGGPGGDTDDFVLTILSGQVVSGDAAANSLSGTAYADSLSGGAGDDTLDGGAGADTLIGGAGSDTYAVNSALDQVVEQPGAGIDTVRSSVALTLGSNLENLRALGTGAIALTGNAAANQLVGNGASNRLSGLGGNDNLAGGASRDLLYGGTGADKLGGGAGNDLLLGGAGGDTLRGELGNDVLRGGAGADLLIGGAGADRFVFETAPASGVDRIGDFGNGNDAIVLDAGVFPVFSAGVAVTNLQFAAGDGLDQASTAAQRLLYDTQSGRLWYDSDGSGAQAAVVLAVLGTTTHPALTAADFLIVA